MSESEPIIVEVERSGRVESTHLVDVAVSEPEGALLAWAGDAGTVAYFRSAAKPIQASACLESGWKPPAVEQLAVACASHNGEVEHVEAVRLTLGSAGVTEDALRCPPAWPFPPEAAAGLDGPAPMFHNCSGKHAAMLAASIVNRWPIEDYRSGAHPLQGLIAARIEDLAGPPLAIAVDGCGVPTFAMTLGAMARAYAALPVECTEALDAMATRPFLVAGTGRLCTAIMKSLPGVVVKIGAEGLLCGVLRDRRIGFAIKCRDGAARGRDAATLSVLRELAAFDDAPEALARFQEEAVTGGGIPVGSIRTKGTVKRA